MLIRLTLLSLTALFAGGAHAAEVPLKWINAEQVKVDQQVAISNFVVEFQDSYIKTKTGFHILGMGSFDSNTATNSVKLPDASVLQSLTDLAYQRVKALLAARGVQVVGLAALSGAAAEADVRLRQRMPIQSGQAYENRDGTSVLYTPTGVTSILPYNGGCDHYVPLLDHKSVFERMSAQGLQMKSAVAANGQPGDERALARALGVPLLKFWVTVGFGEVEANGAGSFIAQRQKSYITATETVTVANAANAKATSGLFLKPEVTRVAITNPVDSDREWSCGISMFNAFKPPADGEALIGLGDKLRDDGGEVKSLSTAAGDIKVNQTDLGHGVMQATVSQGAGQVGGSAGGKGDAVQVTSAGSSTSGVVDVGDGNRTQLNTRSDYVTTIRADYYATSVFKMIDDAATLLTAAIKK